MKTHVKVPATTANLGPAFDALGMALNLWNEAVFSSTADEQVRVTVRGEGQDKLPTNEENLIAASALRVFELAGVRFNGLKIECLNRIPLASGLGSSSAAVLTGLLGANSLLGNPFKAQAILNLAIETEGHPDNLAPAMLGGLVASIIQGEQVITRRLDSAASRSPIHATIALPDFEFPTKEARQILPREVSRQDAVHNISRAILVAEALRTGDLGLLGIAMKDTLHQPYRLPRIPGAVEALEAAKQTGAAAVALSGAGPGLIAFSSGAEPGIGAAMQAAFSQVGMTSRLFELETSGEGAEVVIV